MTYFFKLHDKSKPVGVVCGAIFANSDLRLWLFAASTYAFCNWSSRHGVHSPPVSPPSPCGKVCALCKLNQNACVAGDWLAHLLVLAVALRALPAGLTARESRNAPVAQLDRDQARVARPALQQVCAKTVSFARNLLICFLEDLP